MKQTNKQKTQQQQQTKQTNTTDQNMNKQCGREVGLIINLQPHDTS